MEKQKEKQKQEVKDIIATREDGFGHQFKNARDELNLSIDDVARELHLDKKIIRALESEDYAQLPAAAFVCGYIRNYARFLNIHPEPLIEYYKSASGATTLEPELKITKGAAAPRQSVFYSSLSAIASPLLSLLILLALAAGGWQGWLYISQNYLNDDQSSSENLVLEEAAEAETTELDELNNAEVLLLPELTESEQDLTLQDAPPTPVTETADTLSVDDAKPAEAVVQTTPESTPVENMVADNVSELVVNEVVAEPVNVLAAMPSAEQTQAVPDNQLVLEFSGESWVSIKDADDNTLAVGLKKYPKVMRLTGKIPYKVFLGDATVVKVSFNGKTFDHTKYINSKKIARFKVK